METKQIQKKTLIWLIVALTLLAMVLRLYGITSQPLLSDDVMAAYTADNFIERGHLGPTMFHHPHLRSWLIKGWTSVAGYGPIGLWGISLFFGIAIVPLLLLFMQKLTGNTVIGLLCAFLVAADPAHINFSRQAVQDTTTIFFIVLGTIAVVIADKDNKPLLLLLAGVSFGLGMASKWHALFPWAISAAWVVWRKPEDQGRGAWSLFVFAALAVLPLTVYLATFAPWLMRGYSFTEWVVLQKDLFIENLHHINKLDLLSNPSKAWQWVVMPTGYASFVMSEKALSVSIAMGQPLAWLLTIPAGVFCIVRMIKRKDTWLFFLLLIFAVSYGPLILSPRPIFFISALAVMPFAYALVSFAIVRLTENMGKPFLLIAIYCVLVMIISMTLYPLSIGRSLEAGYLKSLVHSYEPKGLYER